MVNNQQLLQKTIDSIILTIFTLKYFFLIFVTNIFTSLQQLIITN